MTKPPYIRHADGTVSEGRSSVPSQVMSLGLGDATLNRLWVDHGCSLIFGDVRVTIETPFRLRTPGGADLVLDPEERISLGPFLAIFPDHLISASVAADLSLRLDFVTGALIVVPQDGHYEAWQVIGPGSRLVVCPPAGGEGLAIWT